MCVDWRKRSLGVDGALTVSHLSSLILRSLPMQSFNSISFSFSLSTHSSPLNTWRQTSHAYVNVTCTGWHIKSGPFHFVSYYVYTTRSENFCNIPTVSKTFIQLLFSTSTLCCNNWSQSFLKLSDRLINHIHHVYLWHHEWRHKNI